MGQIVSCICCRDWRETGFSKQHGLALPNGIFPGRPDGAFTETRDMLFDAGIKPVVAVQGHNDCVAVKMLLDSFDIDAGSWSKSQAKFRSTHGTVLEMVMKTCSTLPEKIQRAVLERACVAHSINNLLSVAPGMENGRGYEPGAYAYFSMTERLTPEQRRNPHSVPPVSPHLIPLLIFDPRYNVFVRPVKGGNMDIRLHDLLSTGGEINRETFKITRPLDLKAIITNETRYAVAGEIPSINLFTRRQHSVRETPAKGLTAERS